MQKFLVKKARSEFLRLLIQIFLNISINRTFEEIRLPKMLKYRGHLQGHLQFERKWFILVCHKNKKPFKLQNLKGFVRNYIISLWFLQESNQGHMDFQSIALPTELRNHLIFTSFFEVVQK